MPGVERQTLAPARRIDLPTEAEVLADLAAAVMEGRSRLLVVEGANALLCEVAALSLRLVRHPDVLLRAVVEGWPRERIVRELY